MRRSQHFRRFLKGAGRPGKLLDVGCGYGFFLRLAQEAGWEAIGVDPDPQAVAYARSTLRVEALQGDLRDLDFADHSFDLVTLWNVLDYVPDPIPLSIVSSLAKLTVHGLTQGVSILLGGRRLIGPSLAAYGRREG